MPSQIKATQDEEARHLNACTELDTQHDADSTDHHVEYDPVKAKLDALEAELDALNKALAAANAKGESDRDRKLAVEGELVREKARLEWILIRATGECDRLSKQLTAWEGKAIHNKMVAGNKVMDIPSGFKPDMSSPATQRKKQAAERKAAEAEANKVGRSSRLASFFKMLTGSCALSNRRPLLIRTNTARG